MTKYIQSKVVIKKNDGTEVQGGNCYPTAIACLLDINPINVPNIETLWCVGVGYAYGVLHKWLDTKGYVLDAGCWGYSVFHEGNGKIVPDSHIDEYLSSLTMDQKNLLREEFKDQYYMISGISHRGVYHVCIYQNGVMVHDPHPSGDGITTEETFECIKIKNVQNSQK